MKCLSSQYSFSVVVRIYWGLCFWWSIFTVINPSYSNWEIVLFLFSLQPLLEKQILHHNYATYQSKLLCPWRIEVKEIKTTQEIVAKVNAQCNGSRRRFLLPHVMCLSRFNHLTCLIFLNPHDSQFGHFVLRTS